MWGRCEGRRGGGGKGGVMSDGDLLGGIQGSSEALGVGGWCLGAMEVRGL